ncbi:MAG: hypothetical protein ACR2P9_06815, partial [Gammaproteobacteria bacterium]
MLEPIQLSDVFPDEPGAPVDLGTFKVDFWIEDDGRNRSHEMKNVDVKGTLLLRPRDRVHLTIPGIPVGISLAAMTSANALIQFQGQKPIRCLSHSNDGTSSIWEPLEGPLEIKHSSDPGFSIEFVLFGFPDYSSEQRT